MGGLAYDNQSYRKKARLSIKNYLEDCRLSLKAYL